MTTKPYLGRFALCMAGMVALGALLVGLRCGWLEWPYLCFWGAASVTVFLSIMAEGYRDYHAELKRAEDNRQYALELVNAERAWALDNAAQPTLVTTPEPDYSAARLSEWRLSLSRFFRAGDTAASFSIRTLTPDVMSWDDWTRLVPFYCSDAGHRILRDHGGKLGTNWGFGWNLERALQALATEKLPLPPGDAPVVEVYVSHTTQRNAPKRKAGAVVEGVARAAD